MVVGATNVAMLQSEKRGFAWTVPEVRRVASGVPGLPPDDV